MGHVGYEGVYASGARPHYYGPGSILDGRTLTGAEHVLTIEGDDVWMMLGTPAQLRTLHKRMGDVLDAEPEHTCGDDDECPICGEFEDDGDEDESDDDGYRTALRSRLTLTDDGWALAGRVLSFDEVEALGLDGTLRDT